MDINKNYDYVRYAGYREFGDIYTMTPEFFSDENIKYISDKITSKLLIHLKLNIRVKKDILLDVMNTVYHNRTTQQVGDIYSRYIIKLDPQNEVKRLNDQVVEIAYSQISNEYEIVANNNKLNVWDATVLGDFNKLGLRAHPKIKIKEKHPQFMAFFENY
jgi:hypothetical protein